jgi:hypothetical protein
MRRNPGLQAVIRELEAAGIHHTVTNGGRHIKVRGDADEGPRTTDAATASDHRAPLNARAHGRRQIPGACS